LTEVCLLTSKQPNKIPKQSNIVAAPFPTFFLPILSFVFQKCLIRQQTTKQASLAAPTPVLFLNVSTMDYGFYGLLWWHFKTSLSPSMEVHHLHQFSMVPLFLLNSQQDDLRRVASL
jgi:hypothetical protein